MSEFSHIEVTIETVATDGTRTRTTRWACPSVEMGSTGDGRVQLRFAGDPVVVAGEPATRCPVDGLRYVKGVPLRTSHPEVLTMDLPGVE